MDKKGKKVKVENIPRPFKLTHQLLCITSINFQRKALMGNVDLTLQVQQQEMKSIKVSCKQSRIHKVCVNKVEATFQYQDPSLDLTQRDPKSRNLEFLSMCHLTAVESVDPDCGYNGEITIRVPSEVQKTFEDQNMVNVSLHFTLEDPQGGIHFVGGDGSQCLKDQAAHLFTSGHENSARLWFPCIDTYSEPCTWKLEFTVDESMTAVSCGDLIETVYTADRKRKTFHYVVSVPTAAPNICLAVGPFEILVDPHMHEVTHFCLPQLMPLLEYSTQTLHNVFEFLEELLSFRFPYSCYKQVFVHNAYSDAMSYSSIGIFSTNLLHSKIVLDQTPISRQKMARTLAEQFFGCFMAQESWSDFWVTSGIAGYLYGLWLRTTFGNSEYRHWIATEIEDLCKYEINSGAVLLQFDLQDCSFTRHFPHQNPHTVPESHYNMIKCKAHLIMRKIENHIGPQLLLQAFNKILSLANASSNQKMPNSSWSAMLLSTSSFLKSIYTVSGKDLAVVVNQWLEEGIVCFCSSFVFNRKRNIVELELKQDMSKPGTTKYVGPLNVRLQELDGSFNHTIQIEENTNKHDIPCHSKSRRNKRKKIPLMNGDETDIDLNAMDPDSPVLWIRIDPDMNVLRTVHSKQPDYMWQYQSRFERDILGQLEAIKSLEHYDSEATRCTLTDIIENEQYYYKVRIAASECLFKVANAMVGSWTGPPAMLDIFTKFFCCETTPPIVKMNNFSNLQQYFLQKHIPKAMSHLRNSNGVCPKEVLQFLLDIIKLNDNSKNQFSDNYYRASLIDSLSNTVSHAVVLSAEQLPTAETMSTDARAILDEVTRFLNLEKHLPSYRYSVTVSCLHALRNLQRHNHLLHDAELFKSYAIPGFFHDVRVAAIHCIVDLIRTSQSKELLQWLLGLGKLDLVSEIKIAILRALVNNPPFAKEGKSPLNNADLVEHLWNFINHESSHNSQLRCEAIDLYFTLFGKARPHCLPAPQFGVVVNLKERKAHINPTVKEKVSHQEKHTEPNIDVPMKQRRLESHPVVSSANTDQENKLKVKIKFGSGSQNANMLDTDDVMAAESLLSLSHGDIPSRPSTPGGMTDNLLAWSSPIDNFHVSSLLNTDSHLQNPSLSQAMSMPLVKDKKKKRKHKHKHKHKHRADDDWSSPATPASSVTSPFPPSPTNMD